MRAENEAYEINTQYAMDLPFNPSDKPITQICVCVFFFIEFDMHMRGLHWKSNQFSNQPMIRLSVNAITLINTLDLACV